MKSIYHFCNVRETCNTKHYFGHTPSKHHDHRESNSGQRRPKHKESNEKQQRSKGRDVWLYVELLNQSEQINIKAPSKPYEKEQNNSCNA